MRRSLGILAFGAIALAACSHPPSGRVDSKHYEARYVLPLCNLVGKVIVCTPTVHPEEWVITLTDGADQWDVQVSQTRYDATRVGDTVPTDVP